MVVFLIATKSHEFGVQMRWWVEVDEEDLSQLYRMYQYNRKQGSPKFGDPNLSLY